MTGPPDAAWKPGRTCANDTPRRRRCCAGRGSASKLAVAGVRRSSSPAKQYVMMSTRIAHRWRWPVPDAVRHRGVFIPVWRPVHGSAELRTRESVPRLSTSRRCGTSRLTTRSCARYRTRRWVLCSWRCQWRRSCSCRGSTARRTSRSATAEFVEAPARHVLRHLPGAHVARPQARRWHQQDDSSACAACSSSQPVSSTLGRLGDDYGAIEPVAFEDGDSREGRYSGVKC